MGKCKVCKKSCDGEYCFRHKPRKPFPKSRIVVSKKMVDIIENMDKQSIFFSKIWLKRPHYSEISGKFLGWEPLTIFFHHILPKEKYPEAEFDEDNIILLTWEEHDQVEMDIYRYDVINEKRENLLMKYQK
jgi:hypothetical protein